MKILQLTNKIPFPPIEGGSIAINLISQGLIKAGHQVKILSMNTSKQTVDFKILPNDYKQNTCIEIAYVDNRIKPFDALINLIFTKKSYHLTRFISKEFNAKLIEILKREKFDIIQLEMLYVTPYIDTIRKYSEAKIILRTHNIEHYIWERMAASSKNPLKKYYLSILTKRLKKYESAQINNVDGIAAISPQDLEYLKELGCRVPIIDIPVGFDISSIQKTNIEPEFPGIFHLGSMNWMPNIEGIRWFVNEVWPGIRQKHKDCILYLAGRNFPKWFTENKFPGIEIVGEVINAANFLNSKQIMIVPLLSGSGMRVKIIEGMAYGKTIISTTIGAEGILFKDGHNIIIANSPEEFIDAVSNCISNSELCKSIGDNASQLIKDQYDNTIITTRLEMFYQRIIYNEKI